MEKVTNLPDERVNRDTFLSGPLEKGERQGKLVTLSKQESFFSSKGFCNHCKACLTRIAMFTALAHYVK